MSAPGERLIGEGTISSIPGDAVSRVKVSRNAKGDPQWEISVVDGSSSEDLTALRIIAIAEYRALYEELVGVVS